MRNMNTKKRNSKFIEFFTLKTSISNVTNSGAARGAGGLAPLFFVNMAVSVLEMHIALFSRSDNHVEPITLKQAQMFKNGTLRFMGLIWLSVAH